MEVRLPLHRPRRRSPALAVAFSAAVALFTLAGCDDTVPAKGNPGDASTPKDSPSSGGDSSPKSKDASPEAADAGPPVDRGPKNVPLATSPNGLFWNPATATLLIADDDGNRVLTWTDGAGLGAQINLPTSPPIGLGQVVQTSDGTVLVARFGFGTSGDIAYVKNDGTKGTVPGLDVTRRRIGLGIIDDTHLYETYFIAVPTGYAGAIAEVNLAGGEKDVVPTLQKPVGVITVGSTLYFSDQGLNEIFDPAVSKPGPVVLAMLPGPDLICAGPSGSIFTGGGTTARQVAADGTFTDVGTGFAEVRGVAYDAANKRLFIADHGNMQLGIVPID
jgi:hypothetical protein